MECREVKERLSAHLDGELDESTSRRVIHHLEGCDACREEFGAMRRIDRSMRALPILEAPPGFSRELAAGVGGWDAFSGARVLNRSIPAALLELLGYLSEFLERRKGPTMHLLAEFDDFPPLSLGRTYFRMLGRGCGGCR